MTHAEQAPVMFEELKQFSIVWGGSRKVGKEIGKFTEVLSRVLTMKDPKGNIKSSETQASSTGESLNCLDLGNDEIEWRMD